jgi:hypothetical protein
MSSQIPDMIQFFTTLRQDLEAGDKFDSALNHSLAANKSPELGQGLRNLFAAMQDKALMDQPLMLNLIPKTVVLFLFAGVADNRLVSVLPLIEKLINHNRLFFENAMDHEINSIFIGPEMTTKARLLDENFIYSAMALLLSAEIPILEILSAVKADVISPEIAYFLRDLIEEGPPAVEKGKGLLDPEFLMVLSKMTAGGEIDLLEKLCKQLSGV